MKNEIALFTDPITDPKILIKKDSLDAILKEIDDVGNTIIDLSTMDGVDEVKELKKTAKEWVDSIKTLCEPLEADGKKVSVARSTVTTRLLTGKDSVINKMLNPIIEAEKKLSYLVIKVSTPIRDMRDCEEIIIEAKELLSFNWLAYKSQAAKLLAEYKTGAEARKVELETLAKVAQDKLDAENAAREKEIADAAEERGRVEEKARQEKELEEQPKIGKVGGHGFKNMAMEDKETAEDDMAHDIEHEKKIHNEILDELGTYLIGNGIYTPEACRKKCIEIITAIAKGKIPNLRINY